MQTTASTTLTIGKLAKAAGVGVETIRYYQQRGLLPVPESRGAYRHYPAALGQRIRFIKRAQELGFSLDEVAELLSLEDGLDRQAIRQIAGQRLDEIRTRLADLQRMQQALSHLIDSCEHTGKELPCPIIETLAQAGDR
jgi:Hg(II)-responsive transcriptional regulator